MVSSPFGAAGGFLGVRYVLVGSVDSEGKENFFSSPPPYENAPTAAAFVGRKCGGCGTRVQ